MIHLLFQSSFWHNCWGAVSFPCFSPPWLWMFYAAPFSGPQLHVIASSSHLSRKLIVIKFIQETSTFKGIAESELPVPGASLLLDFLCVTWYSSLWFKLMNEGFLLPVAMNLSHSICSWAGTEIMWIGSVQSHGSVRLEGLGTGVRHRALDLSPSLPPWA